MARTHRRRLMGAAYSLVLGSILALAACRPSADSTADARRTINSQHGRGAQAAARALPRQEPGKQYTRPGDRTLRGVLTPLQYQVVRKGGTERPFANAYWDNKRAGIYVDIVSGEPLFASIHKFDSGTGWPSFFRPLESSNVIKRTDTSHLMVRVEVRSKHGDSHLGHLFRDGPRPTGLRYCINSAALRFVPRERISKEGYGRYAKLFGR